MMPPISQLTDAQLLAAVSLLNSPAYRDLSRFHTDYLTATQDLAKSRKLTLPPTKHP
jgi:hypothetical protein